MPADSQGTSRQTVAEVMSAAVSHYFAVLGRLDLWDFLRISSWAPRPSQWRVRSATAVFRNEVHPLLERRRAREAAAGELPRDIVTLLTLASTPPAVGRARSVRAGSFRT